MGYERNDRRPGAPYGDRGDAGRESYRYGARDEGDRGQGYGSYGGAGGRDYRGERFNDQPATGYGRDPRGYDNDRGFFERAGDEVRSWFGDEDAERRRREDERRYGYTNGNFDESRSRTHYGAYRSSGMTGDAGAYGNSGGNWGNERSERHDPSYRSWRDRQMEAFDRDYDEYRRENQSRFDQEFHSWRQGRQGQRDLLGRVNEHQEVVGSDGQHVGTVDHVRDDRILLTKNDEGAGGRHHSIPSSWLQSVDEKVTLSKTADQARQHWRDEERDRDGGLFGQSQNSSARAFDRSSGQR